MTLSFSRVQLGTGMLCLCSPLLSASVEKEVSPKPRGGGGRGSSGAVWGGAVVIAGE